MTHPLRQALADIISRIAQHACRQGESGERDWPPLAQLPLLKSWRCVGTEFYADDALAALLAAAMLSQATEFMGRHRHQRKREAKRKGSKR